MGILAQSVDRKINSLGGIPGRAMTKEEDENEYRVAMLNCFAVQSPEAERLFRSGWNAHKNIVQPVFGWHIPVR